MDNTAAKQAGDCMQLATKKLHAPGGKESDSGNCVNTTMRQGLRDAWTPKSWKI